ncbi:hypothetical protein [Heyndrickxia vini]|uniref:Uncharacterized protein n=1 Tax=Heyndrickxia vini TaxID=1476025 RepID=A0ABX7DXB3_9BACI|nr:hypothetical protein [Heyndrickxia vini]QQZ07755.1 hypothetical protein I5776_11680 [Heyndrickxia vini]
MEKFTVEITPNWSLLEFNEVKEIRELERIFVIFIDISLILGKYHGF